MTELRTRIAASWLLLTLAGAPLQAGSRELATVESAAETVHALSAIPLAGIPPALLRDAKGVAVIPGVLKAGFVLGGRFGRGVVLVRQADGNWSNPVFVTLTGGGIGWQVGIQSTDVVLVFQTGKSLDRILQGKGKLTLGGDVAVAVGPVGRQAEAATDGRLQAEIYSYSRSRGLFVGLSLEGAGLLVDCDANEAFYGIPGGSPAAVLAVRGATAVAGLRGELAALSLPPAPPVVIPFPQAPPLPPPTRYIPQPPPDPLIAPLPAGR